MVAFSRVAFVPPSENDFKILFDRDKTHVSRRGSGLSDITVFSPPAPIRYRKGAGIFSAISGIAKRVIPLLFRAAKPAVKEFGVNMVKDIVSKRPIKKSLKKHGLRAVRKTGRNLLRGSGRVKKAYKKNVYSLI